MNKFLKIAIVVVICIIVALAVTIILLPGNGGTTTTTSSSSSSSSSTSSSTTTSTNRPDTDPEPDPDKDITDADKTVYVIATALNLHTTPDIVSDNVKGSLPYATELHCTGENDEVVRVVIEDETFYVSKEYVSENKPVTEFDERNDTVYIISVDSLNIRGTTNLDFADNIITSLGKGTALKRTGLAPKADAEGIVWARVEFLLNEKTTTGYVNNKYLSTTPEKEEDADMGFTFTDKNDVLVVVAPQSVNLRTKASLKSEIGAYVIKGTALKRIGIATKADKDGITWSKVIYNGKTYYVSSNENYVKVKDPTDTSKEKFDLLHDGKYNITLPATFDITNSYTDESNQKVYVLESDDSMISVNFVPSLNGKTITQLAEAMIPLMKEELGESADFSNSTVKTKDGVIYFDYTMTVSEGTETAELYFIVAFHAGTESGSCYITTLVSVGTKAQAESTLWGYIDTIKIVTPTPAEN